ncbi:MAG: putative lipase essential for disintegration of autophagic bodies inside the vacuole, partial [Elusimicrobia bacterium]
SRAAGPSFPAVSVAELRAQGAASAELEGAPVAGRGEASDRVAVANAAHPYAVLSANAYHDREEDWCPVIDRRRDPKTGFDAYACRETSAGRVIVVFRGTDELKDWVRADIPQPFFLPRQYKQGLEYARELQEAHGDVAVTGHSLGGGIAQYAASRLGLEAWTFNPAGLGLEATLRAMTCDPADGPCPDASRVTNVIVAGEPLAAVRYFIGPDFVRLRGATVHFLPAGGGGLTSHGMSNVLAALDAKREKPSDERYARLAPR